MRSIPCRAGLWPTFALAAIAVAGCNTSQPAKNSGGSRSAAPAKQGQATVQEAKTMEKHGEQLKAQGDETGGDRLIEQAKVKEAEGKAKLEKAAKPQTRPGQ